MVSLPPSGMASRALTARFTITCSSWFRSALIGQRSRPWLDLQRDRLAEQPVEQHGDVGEHLAELDDARPQRLPARESQQLPHQPGRAVGVLLDVHDVLEGRVGRPVAGEQQVGEADDGGQHVVEVVRDAAGELADRLHLLALRELRLERALLGRLERVDDGGVLAVICLPGSG